MLSRTAQNVVKQTAKRRVSNATRIQRMPCLACGRVLLIALFSGQVCKAHEDWHVEQQRSQGWFPQGEAGKGLWRR